MTINLTVYLEHYWFMVVSWALKLELELLVSPFSLIKQTLWLVSVDLNKYLFSARPQQTTQEKHPKLSLTLYSLILTEL